MSDPTDDEKNEREVGPAAAGQVLHLTRAQRIDLPVARDDGIARPARGIASMTDGALRSLIREILREELAGETGRRMTGRMRKLVHAEIAARRTENGRG